MQSEIAGARSGSPVLRIVGGIAIALSVLGIWYHSTVLTSDFSRRDKPPYFFQAWYTMAGINIALLVAAGLAGIQLLRLKIRWVVPFVVIEALIVLDAFIPGLLWLHPEWGKSIAAASGISGGGIFHVITLFPIWGSVVAVFASRRIRRAQIPMGV